MATPLLNIDDFELPRFIAIEGPIGVGKTTLATKLADSFRYPTLLEPSTENPFLDGFYRGGGRNALPTQLFFLLHRAQQFSQLGDSGLFSPVVVSDFLMEKDRLFAEITLDANELELYDRIRESLDITPPQPDLVIYLQAPETVLAERIRSRGIAAEQHIGGDYLGALIEAYARFFHFYDAAPVLIVNATEVDLASNDAHYRELVERIVKMNGVRQYFNPHPTLI
jgi:deoxyadenosine/deoxycytidine kinase